MGAPFLLPTITAILGLVAVFGRNGAFNRVMDAVGLAPVPLYGAQGVVLAHVFLNMPLCVRMILNGWAAIPAERIRLAQSLHFGPGAVWRHLERPMLIGVVPGAALAVFAICLTSFAVALTLGGGPAATTVELGIYQALRYDFDLSRAALLALVQVLLGLAALAVVWTLGRSPDFGAGLDRAHRALGAPGWRRGADTAVILLAVVFVATPLLAVLSRGAGSLASLPTEVWQAALRSTMIAVPSGVLATSGALALALVPRGRWAEAVAMLPMAMSSLVLGTGLFLLVLPHLPPARLALPVTALINATLALPFAYRALRPDALTMEADFARLSTALGLSRWSRLTKVTLPRLRRALGFALGVTIALSMGDLGVIALFADEATATLPLMVQRLMGAYRMDDAMGAALVLAGLSFAAFLAFDLWGRRRADT